MQTRRESRELILKILFQHEYGSVELGQAVKNLCEESCIEDSLVFIKNMVYGITEHKELLDQFIEKYALGWDIERIARVDLIVLRMGLYEIIFCSDIPYEVTINEAVEIVKLYGGENSGSFINGILAGFLNNEDIEIILQNN